MKLQVKSQKSNIDLEFFPGTVVLGNNKQSSNNQVLIFNKGIILNDRNTDTSAMREHHWGTWYTEDLKAEGKRAVRHYPIAHSEAEFTNKRDICDRMGISSLKSINCGHDFYFDTDIGDVLYITYDVNEASFIEVARVGFIDKKRMIHAMEARKRYEASKHLQFDSRVNTIL